MADRTFTGLLTKQVHNLTDQILNRAIAELDLTPTQAHVLGYLVRHRDTMLCLRDVEECFGLTHPTVSGILSRLEDKGFLTFCPDKRDRRIKRIAVTDRALECDARIRQAIDNMEARVIRDFTPEEQTQLNSLLCRAIRNLGGEPCRIQNHKKEDSPK